MTDENVDEKEFPKIDYRIKRIDRFLITRCVQFEDGQRVVNEKGMYDNADIAYEVGYALAKHDARECGFGPADERIQYPRHPNGDGHANPGAIL